MVDCSSPIYIQIIEKIKFAIISGQYEPGEKLPGVRELALNNKVNPNTIQKAMAELESLGLIYTESTNGKFVTKDKNIICKVKEKSAKKIVNEYVETMRQMGISVEEAIEYMINKGDKNE